MDIERTREEYNRLLEELARMMPDDPKYQETLKAAESLSKIIGEYERRDLERINSNIRNDISEEELRVNMAKVKSDRFRSWTEVLKSALGVGSSIGLGILAYHNDAIDFKLAVRSVWDMAKSLIPKR